MLFSKPYQIHIWAIYGSPPFPKLDFGLFEPTILFSHSSAVSHLKSRDFRFHEPTILFSNWSAVSPTGNDMTSSSGHVIALDQSGASISAKLAHLTTVRNAFNPSGTIRKKFLLCKSTKKARYVRSLGKKPHFWPSQRLKKVLLTEQGCARLRTGLIIMQIPRGYQKKAFIV